MGWLLGNQATSHQAERERERELRGWIEMEKEGGREEIRDRDDEGKQRERKRERG